MNKVDQTPTIRGFQGTYRWLSNFWPCPVTYEGMTYRTVEHAYQAAKSVDINTRQKLQACPSPGAAKKMGRSVVVREDWITVRQIIMKDLLREKFRHGDGPEGRVLWMLLRNTEEAPLVEENCWHDNFWGSCTCEKCGNKGGNWLGILLMQVREEVR